MLIKFAGFDHIKKIYGVEIQEENATLAKRSIIYNQLENKIEIINESTSSYRLMNLDFLFL